VLLAAAQVLTIALPWNVPLWWFARRLRMAIEIDCDARVLRSGVDPAHYGEVLLAVGQHRGHVPANAAALIEPVTQLERRIRIMLTRPTVISKHRAAAALALTLVIAACATRLEAPSISTSPIPGDDLSSQLVLGNGRVEMSAQMMQVRQAVAPSTADTIVLADVVLRIADAIQSRPTTVRAAKLTASGDDILLEGDVRLIHEQTSIVTPRARIKTTPDGITLIEMDGAELIRTE
jgi:hypothetical protein